MQPLLVGGRKMASWMDAKWADEDDLVGRGKQCSRKNRREWLFDPAWDENRAVAIEVDGSKVWVYRASGGVPIGTSFGSKWEALRFAKKIARRDGADLEVDE